MPLVWFTFIIGTVVTLRDIKLSSYRVLLNPFFWTMFFSILYLVIPAFFILEINLYFQWVMDGASIFHAQLLVFIFIALLGFLYYIFPSYKLASIELGVEQSTGFLVKIIWFAIFLYLSFVLYKSIQSGVLLNAFIYDFKQDDPYKIKNVAYVLIPISIYMFAHARNHIVFLPNLIVASIDLMNGSRTIAFIALVPIAITFCVNRKRLYVLPGILLIAGMLLLGIFRLGAGIGEIPWYISALGEFRETYLTLPLYISNETYVGIGTWDNLVASFFQGVLQPFRGFINNEYAYAGSYIAKDIGRGYGLGSNFLTAIIYYGYQYFFITIPIFCGLLIFFYRLISKLKMAEKLVLVSLLVIFIRLIIREGLYTSLGIFCFICIFYWFSIYLVSKIKLKAFS